MNLKPRVSSNFSAALISPKLPSLIKSGKLKPWFWYCLATDTTKRRLARVNFSSATPVSYTHLDVYKRQDNSLLDVLVNDDSPMADRSLVNESLARDIDRALSTLTDREKEIIQMFFGIGQQEMTLEEIGDKFGLTRERVRQIKEKAIRRLRQSNRSKLLKSYLG